MASQGPITWLPRINHTLWLPFTKTSPPSLWAGIFSPSASYPTNFSGIFKWLSYETSNSPLAIEEWENCTRGIYLLQNIIYKLSGVWAVWHQWESWADFLRAAASINPLPHPSSFFLASQDALEVMGVSEWVSEYGSVSTELTDVTLVSDDTYWRLYRCWSGKWGKSYLVRKIILWEKVILW